ncbi:MAG: type I restriction enzyme HsdR N-terminal domain-containing protein [Muribaculaceae bacterium]|nr:type I restriction enzyme HsdR N-terminal domain-containing protein [Muribaculaceae bacterium]
MPPLNLPPARLNIRRDERSGEVRVFDRLRRKWIVLTPEEWVRQHFTRMLIDRLGYPEGRMANEVSLTLNGTARRCDTVVFDSRCEPEVIVEYKAPTVPVTQAVFDQIVRYNMVMKARMLIVSNGINHYCCLIDYATHSYRFLPEIPAYSHFREQADQK